MIYKCNDGNCEVEIDAESAEDAAQEYVNGGDWGRIEETTWINVWVEDEDGDRERVKVTLNPDEPRCEGGNDHDWQSPHEVVGGIKENPGVWGNGGGVKITEVCIRCGCGKHVDTWAHDPSTGEQGLESVRYVEGEFEDEVAELANA